jgi:hypothetical protein
LNLNSLIVILLAASVLLVVVGTAEATDLFVKKWFTYKPEYCISPSFSSSLQSAIRTGTNDLNALPSKFILREEAWGPNCYSYIYPYKFTPNYIAMTSIYASGTPPTINKVNTAVNTYYTWTGASTCSMSFNGAVGPYNLRATWHHEAGHWIQMRHPTGTVNTVMMPNFSCSYWSTFKPHDSSTISSVYDSMTVSAPVVTPGFTMVDFALPPNLDRDALAKRSQLIVFGEVVDKGNAPAVRLDSNGPTDVIIPQERNVIKIDRVLRGDYDKPTVEVFTPTSAKSITVDDAVNLKEGEGCIFMLFEFQGKYELTGLRQGCVKDMSPDKFSREVLNVEPKQELREQQQEQEQEPRDIPNALPKLREQQEDKEEPEWKRQLREQLGLRDENHNRTADDERRELLRIVT